MVCPLMFFFWWVVSVQKQKEAAMIKALENNMGDVDMISVEGERDSRADCLFRSN